MPAGAVDRPLLVERLARGGPGPIVSVVSAAGGHASSDATVTWVRRHPGLLHIGGAVLAALALLIFSVNWVTLLIIAVLLALYEFGLHRLRQTQPRPAANTRP